MFKDKNLFYLSCYRNRIVTHSHSSLTKYKNKPATLYEMTPLPQGLT